MVNPLCSSINYQAACNSKTFGDFALFFRLLHHMKPQEVSSLNAANSKF